MLAKFLPMTSTRHRGSYAYRAVTHLAVKADSTEQARRRAARWHAWLKSPECTFQDRENFERWCRDANNAAAYVALCGDLVADPELPDDAPGVTGFDYGARALASASRSPLLEVERR